MENTQTAPRTTEDLFSGEVIRLREWASDHAYPLPPSAAISALSAESWLVGSGADCALQIYDPSRRTSRHHASLMRELSQWSLLDLGSKNGLLVDGVRQTTALLRPGREIGMGGVTLIAESADFMVLRSFLARILGWGEASKHTVDLAIRAIRMAQARRVPLILCGEGDLVPIAAALHRRIWGKHRPFILSDPRLKSMESTIRSSTNLPFIGEALEAARGGTLCVRSNRPPAGFTRAVEGFHDPESQFQLILCGSQRSRADEEATRALMITIPPLSARKEELDQIIHEYLVEAALALRTAADIDNDTIDWIREHSSRSLHEIEKGAYRLTAMAISEGPFAAAEKLGMAAVSLRRWLHRRAIPPICHAKDPEIPLQKLP